MTDRPLERPAPSRPIRTAAGVVISVFLAVTALTSVHLLRGALEEGVGRLAVPAPEVEHTEASLRASLTRIERSAERLQPRGAYLVVSSTDNTFRLMSGTDTLRAGLCSTGSYVRLTAGDGRSWLFTTPRGRRTVQEKRVGPVWSKPDWAFVEAGLPVPSPGSPDRYERGVLGRFALSLGDGYLVHGTPYQRLLGMPVTHGCVRLGDADLEAVFGTLPIGASVLLY